MRGLLKIALVAGILAQVSALQAAGVAPSPVKWQTNLKQAAVEAQRSGKPIMVQMTAPWCGYCHKMLKETFTDPAVAKTVNEYFVPLLLDADENPQAVEILAINSFPSTVIISPQYEEQGRLSGYIKAAEFNKRIAPFCKTAAKTTSAATTTAAATAAKAPAAIAKAQPAPAPKAAAARPEFEDTPEFTPPEQVALASAKAPLMPEPTASAEAAPALKQTAAIARPEPKLASKQALKTVESAKDTAPAKLAFGGMCLVSMQQGKEVLDGSAEFTHTHNGHQLRFTSAEHLAEFKGHPEKFWPLFDGQCPVAIARDEKQLAGDPEVAGLYHGRLIFFVDEAHRDEFVKAPRQFIRPAPGK